MKKNNLVFAALAVLVIIGTLVFVSSSKNQTSSVDDTEEEEEMEEAIPTVDASVKVDLTGKNNKRAVELSVAGVPKGTTSIEYSLSYNTKSQGLQGIIGTLETDDGKRDYTISRELGTCSSGTCIFHEVVGPIKVEMKFSGEYGERIFDKEYTL